MGLRKQGGGSWGSGQGPSLTSQVRGCDLYSKKSMLEIYRFKIKINILKRSLI